MGEIKIGDLINYYNREGYVENITVAEGKTYYHVGGDIVADDEVEPALITGPTAFPSSLVKQTETKSDSSDNINEPSHYTQGGIEPIDFIKSNNMSFLEGNVIKYVTRYKFKNGLEDLKKAKAYLDILIKETNG